MRSKCEPAKILEAKYFSFCGADDIALSNVRDKKNYCLSLAEYYEREFSYKIKNMKITCLVAESNIKSGVTLYPVNHIVYPFDENLYPLEIVYIQPNIKLLSK